MNAFHKARLAAGLSIYKLAERAGCHWQTILRAERGGSLSNEMRERIENSLQTALDERARAVEAARTVIPAA